jgi:hypothetical protein
MKRAFAIASVLIAACLCGAWTARTTIPAALVATAGNAWTPEDLGASVTAWWDWSRNIYADIDGATNATAGVAVRRWDTRYGISAQATNTAAAGPLYATNGLAYSLGKQLNIASTNVSQTVNENVFAVINASRDQQSWYSVLLWGHANPVGWGTLLSQGDINYASRITRLSDGYTYARSTTWPAGFKVLQFSVSGATNSIWYAGAQGTVDAGLPTTRSHWTYIGVGGSGNEMVATLRHVLIVAGDLDTATRQRIEGWGHWDCGAQSLLATNHPYYSAPPTK